MPRVTLELSDEALARVRTALTVRKMASETWGVCEQLVARIVDALDAREDHVTLKTREERAAEAARLGETDSDSG